MADIFEALSEIRKGSGTSAAAVAEPEAAPDAPPSSGGSDIFSALESIRAAQPSPKGRPPDEINPPIAPTTVAREMVRNTIEPIKQGALDLAGKVRAAARSGLEVAKDTGHDLIDALSSIRQSGVAKEVVKNLPETVGQIGKDVAGVVTKAGAGAAKGLTFGAINPEQGTVGVPFTSKKWQVAPKLTEALKEMGVSPEIAENAYIETGPEMAASIAPWSRVSKTIGTLAKVAEKAAKGAEVTTQAAAKTEQFLKLAFGTPLKEKIAQAGLRVAQEGATGAVVGAAQVRDKGQSMAENAGKTAAFGAGIGAAAEAVGLGSAALKLREVNRFYKNLRAIFYEAKATDAAAADAMAKDVVGRVVRKGGIDAIPRTEIKQSADALEEMLHEVKRNPKSGPTGRPTETTVEVTPEAPKQITAPEAPTAAAEQPPVAAAAPAAQPELIEQGPVVYPEVSRLEADTTPGMEPAAAPRAADDIHSALAEIRKTDVETPPAPSGALAQAPPPEQKGNPTISIAEAQAQGYVLPKEGMTPPREGKPYLLFKADDPVTGRKIYDLFGASDNPAHVHKGTFYGDNPAIAGVPIVEGVLSPMQAKPQGRAFSGAKTAEEIAEGLSPEKRQMYRKAYEENDKKILMQLSMDPRQQGEIYTAIRNLQRPLGSPPEPSPSPQAIEQAPPAPVETKPESAARQTDVFPAPARPSMESIARHPDYIKVSDDALSVVKRYAERRGETPGPDYGKKLWQELHDALGEVRKAKPEERVAVAKRVMEQHPNIEADFVALKDKLWADATEGYFEKFLAKTPVEATEPDIAPSGALARAPMAAAEPPPPGKKAPAQGDLFPPEKEVPPPEATPEAPIFELPEMVELSKELMEGKYPQVVKKIRAAGGNALGVFYPGRGIIQIRADQFKNPEDAAHTLSHEIGHLADWLPDKDINRGNIIGRIASLQRYLKDEFLGESWDKHLKGNKKFRNELINLTNRWHPFDFERAPQSYLSYRYSSPELYAEAWSALLNNPKFLKDAAPEFYKAFFDYLDRKPQVKALYDDLHEVIREGKTAETRHARETAAYAKGDLAAKLKNEARDKPGRTIWDELREAFVDENAKIISSVARARRAGQHVTPEENPMHALEELRYSSAELRDYAMEQGRIYHALKDDGIEWNDLGAYLKADRVINERSEMANPGGQTPKAAREEIELLRKKYGDKFEKLTAAADTMRGENRAYLIAELEKAEMVSPQLLAKIKANKSYAPFDIIIEDAEKSLGGTSSNLGPQIYSQFGTLREVKNPATALVAKDLSLLRAIRVQQAKMKQADWMLKHEPDWIAPAETKWNGVAHVPVEPADRENTGLLAFYQNGKVRAYYVPRTIAESFRYDPAEASLMMDCWDRVNSFFKQVFTAANPGFQVMNVPRDMSSLVMNIRGMSYSKAIRYYIKVAGSAKRFAKGEDDPLIQEMLRRKVLITPQNRWSAVAHDVEMESLINRFSDKENEYKHWYSKVFGPLLDRVKMLGQMSESIAKIAGYQYLKDNQVRFGLNDKDINHLVRFQAGSPPFLVGGKWTRSISRLLLFFGPHVGGWRRSFEAAHNNPGEYAAKTIKYVFLPKLLQYLAWAGVFGVGVQRAYRKVSSYNHANYHIVPIGEGPNGKSIALKIPMDDTERFYGGLLWYALTSQPVAKTMKMLGFDPPEGTAAQDATKLFAYTAGQAPNLTPGVGALVDLVQYASGHNPYDYFRGKPAIPDRIFEAGGAKSHVAMLKYTLNSLGAGLIYRFDNSDVQKVKSDLEKVLGAPVVGNIASRFILSTNYGESELIANRVAEAKKEDAQRRLDYREAVAQNIMAHDKPANEDEIADLYGKMMKEGLLGDALHIKKYGEFRAFYKRLQSQRLDDPYANGLLFAKSDAEKGAVLEVAKENLSADEYDKLVGYSLTQKFISAKTLVSDAYRKASKE
jgi:hypothetical protein